MSSSKARKAGKAGKAKQAAPIQQRPSMSLSELGRGINGPVGVPRFNAYSRLISRFYEAVILLEALDQPRGSQTPAPRSSDPKELARRRFLRDLSYICEFEKGGTSCTAIGLENCARSYKYWVASNADVATMIVPFLEKVLRRLDSLRSRPPSTRDSDEKDFTRICIEFARKKVKGEAHLLSTAITECTRRMYQSSTENGECPTQ